MKNIKLRFASIVVFGIALWLAGCNDLDIAVKSKGFTSPDDFLHNPKITNALAEAMPKISIQAGTNPPTIEGLYSTTQCSYSSTSLNPNIVYQVGQFLNTTLKFYSQTYAYTPTNSQTILLAEKEDNTSSFSSFSNGVHSFIVGQDSVFTLFSENLNTDGSTTASIMSGQLLSSGYIQMQSVIVATANPPTGINVGDWFATEGPLIPVH